MKGAVLSTLWAWLELALVLSEFKKKKKKINKIKGARHEVKTVNRIQTRYKGERKTSIQCYDLN